MPELTESEAKPQTPIKGVSSILSEALKNRRDITPSAIENRGVLAIGGTNEVVCNGFFEEVQKRNPDGYIVGVGVGNVFSLLHGFADNVEPKGIILADIDPRVIAVGKLLINKLKQSETSQEFTNNFFNISDEQFLTEINTLIACEEDSILQERLGKVSQEEWKKIAEQIRSDAWNTNRFDKARQVNPFREGINIDVVTAILNKFAILKKMAIEDSMAVLYADFTNPTFIETIRGLPYFNTSTNIIYLSNIIDHISRGERVKNFSALESVRVYEQSSQPPIFIDTLQSMDYFLRVRRSLPSFSSMDLISMGSMGERKKPRGLIFADEAEQEIGKVDLKELDIAGLHKRYENISGNRLYQEQKNWYEHETNRGFLFEVDMVPSLAEMLYKARRESIDNPEKSKDFYGNGGYRAWYASDFTKVAVQMAELYEEFIKRVWQDKKLNMWRKPLKEVMEALQ